MSLSIAQSTASPSSHAAAALDKKREVESTLSKDMSDLRLGARREKADEAASAARSPSGGSAQKPSVSYTAEKIIGSGSFGVVFLARVVETGEAVAIKKVLQDRRFKNRELQIMRMVKHPNIIAMKHCFFSSGEKPDEIYLNLVLEYMPDTVYRFTRSHFKKNREVPMIYVKLFIYQLCRSLVCIHNMGVCHRDIKPQNLLIDPAAGVLKLCDFGSAKQLIRGEPNVSYICSRYYRAPELIFGATDYTSAIDVWSTGCVMAELLLGRPLFCGETSVDQLVEIIKILGTPTPEQIMDMNPNYTEFKFPNVRGHSWSRVFRPTVPPEALDLINRLLQYSPQQRITPCEALVHPFFDELRDPEARLPDGKPLPPLFDFTDDELAACTSDDVRAILTTLRTA